MPTDTSSTRGSDVVHLIDRARLTRTERNQMESNPELEQLIQGLLDDEAFSLPHTLSDDEAFFVTAEAAKLGRWGLDLATFKAEQQRTSKVVTAPRLRDAVQKLDSFGSHPVVARLLADWGLPRRPGTPGPAADTLTTRAHLLVTAICGHSVHFKTTHELLREAPRVRELAGQLLGAPTSWSVSAYPTSMRHMGRLASLQPPVMAANVALLRELATLLPDAPIGRWLAIDGSKVPAWCPQRGAGGDPELERVLRRNTPEAGFRAYRKKVDGKSDAWRGYRLVAIVDVATALPVVWLSHSADTNETDATDELLTALFDLWPDIPVEALIADKGWDTGPMHELCEVRYGIAPVFHRKEHNSTTLLRAGASRDGTVAGIDPEGRLICSRHKLPMTFSGVERPSRAGLAPGKASDPNKFRVRATCEATTHGGRCGRSGLAMKHNWRRLTGLPRHPDGRPREFARRCALLARRNVVEGTFSRLKTSYRLGTEGEDRVRIRDKDTYDTLIGLALLSMTTHTVVAMRAASGPALAAAA